MVDKRQQRNEKGREGRVYSTVSGLQLVVQRSVT